MAVTPPGNDLEQDAAQDKNAGREERNFDRLDEIEGAKHAVRMAIHRTLAWVIPASLILAFLLFAIGILIYCIQLFTPFGWLSHEQANDLHTILFSSVVGAVVAQGIKRYID